MGYLIYFVPVVLLVSSLTSTWFLCRMIIKLDKGDKPVVLEIENSINQTLEVSNKLQKALLEGQKSYQHQQKAIEHNRVLLASLNSRVAKLDQKLETNNQVADFTNISLNAEVYSSDAEPNQNVQMDQPKEYSGIIKLDRETLPKTKQGIALLEQLFSRRQKFDNSNSTQPITKALKRPADTVEHKNVLRQKTHANPEQSNPRAILNLFAAGKLQSPSSDVQEKRRA